MREKYAAAGVDVSAKDRFIARIGPAVQRTQDARVLSGLGHFGGFFDASELKDYEHPVLVGCTDGVGTKLKLALAGGPEALRGVGIDLVAMCVNDLVACGAKPLYFLDYYASAELDEAGAAAFVEGVARGCELAGCALIGGETAQMPGLYTPPDFDAAGFCTGVVERRDILGADSMAPGLTLLGLASSGFHSNGFSLVRKHIREPREDVLRPTTIYVRPLLALREAIGSALRGIANITGGGLYENIPRILPEDVGATLRHGSWPIPAVIAEVAAAAEMGIEELYATFNGGLGMVVAVETTQAEVAREQLEAAGVATYTVGETHPRGDGPALRVTGLPG